MTNIAIENIGQLRHSVTIQENSGSTRNEHNEITESWTLVGALWAKVEPLRGTEKVEAAQLHANVTHKVTSRWLDGVTPKMRVQHDSRNLYIREVINVDERDWIMELLCEEAV